LNERKTLDLDFYPFKIYSLADEFRGPDLYSPYILSNNWTTFRIRNGAVLTSQVNITGSSVAGTDKYVYPDINTFYLGWVPGVDIVVPTGSNQYYVWIESLTGSYAVSGSSYVIQYATSSQVQSTYVQTPWVTFPSASSIHIPIGYIDNVSSASIQRPFVRQYLRTDVLYAGGGSGSYIPLSACVNGQMVTIYVNGYISGSA
jgi:hypothetical protein